MYFHILPTEVYVILPLVNEGASWRTLVFPRLRYAPLATDTRMQYRPGSLVVSSDPGQSPPRASLQSASRRVWCIALGSFRVGTAKQTETSMIQVLYHKLETTIPPLLKNNGPLARNLWTSIRPTDLPPQLDRTVPVQN
jgi:hypothetical protein